jgi:ParB-like chromosome segregation protein Spo0J
LIKGELSMLKDKLQRVKLADLNPAKYNPNEMDVTERRLLKQSLKHYGYIENIVVNKDLTIIDGHHRVEELLDSGVEEEDVVILDLSKDEEKALNLALRRIKGKADPVLELKIIEDLSLKGFDVELAGFDDVKLQELQDEVPDFKPTSPEDQPRLDKLEPIICPECGYEIQRK